MIQSLRPFTNQQITHIK